MSGLGTYTLQLARELVPVCDKAGFKIELCLIPQADKYFQEFKEKNIFRYVSYPVEDHLRGDMWKNFILPKILDRNCVDIFHDPAYQLPFVRSKAKYIVTIHDLSPFKYPETNTWKYNVYWKFITRRAVKSADRIITVSNYIKDEIEDMFPQTRDRIDVVTEAASSIFSPGDPVRDDPDEKYFHTDQPYFLTTAKYEPRKNLIRCLEAFALYSAEERSNMKLVIAGGIGWKVEDINNVIDRLNLKNRVVMTGYLTERDLVRVIRGALAMVVPSLYEGFGLPVLESMACGTPVLCSDAASLPEVGGDAAIYFDPLDIDSIAGAMSLMAGDSAFRDSLKLAGLNRASEFSWRRTAEKTLQVYGRAMEMS